MHDILKISNLRKVYNNKILLDNINISIKPGMIYCLVGKTNSGKTTLLNIISGLINKTSGYFSLFGVEDDSKNIYKIRKRIGFLIKKPTYYSDLSAYNNLIIYSKLLGNTNKNKIKDSLKQVNLNINNKKSLSKFSPDELKRYAICLTLINDCDFIILDEPFEGLDSKGIMDIRNLIEKLNKEKNITFLLTSYNLTEISKISTDYGFINYGRIIKEAKKEEIDEYSQKSIKIIVDNPIMATAILETKLNIFNYKLTQNDAINIYEEVNISKLLKTLIDENINIINIFNQQQDLERYYFNLVGELI